MQTVLIKSAGAPEILVLLLQEFLRRFIEKSLNYYDLGISPGNFKKISIDFFHELLRNLVQLKGMLKEIPSKFSLINSS